MGFDDDDFVGAGVDVGSKRAEGSFSRVAGDLLQFLFLSFYRRAEGCCVRPNVTYVLPTKETTKVDKIMYQAYM